MKRWIGKHSVPAAEARFRALQQWRADPYGFMRRLFKEKDDYVERQRVADQRAALGRVRRVITRFDDENYSWLDPDLSGPPDSMCVLRE